MRDRYSNLTSASRLRSVLLSAIFLAKYDNAIRVRNRTFVFFVLPSPSRVGSDDSPPARILNKQYASFVPSRVSVESLVNILNEGMRW